MPTSTPHGRNTVTSMLKPEEYFVSVLDIDAEHLKDRGYRAVLLDLDNTLQPRGEQEVPSEIKAWVDGLRDAGLAVAIISNSKDDRVVRAARSMDLLLVRSAFKPFTSGYVTACACLGVACADAVMVGDQSYTDVLGAHRCGMDAFLVMPQNTGDPLHTHLLRAVDALAVRGMRARGGRS